MKSENVLATHARQVRPALLGKEVFVSSDVCICRKHEQRHDLTKLELGRTGQGGNVFLGVDDSLVAFAAFDQFNKILDSELDLGKN